MAMQFTATATDLFYPFILTRSIADMRMGITTIREKWERLPVTSGEAVDPCLLPGWTDTDRLQNSTDLLRFNDKALREDFMYLTANRDTAVISSTNRITRPEAVFAEEGVVMEHCIINAEAGPVYIGKQAQVMEGSMLRGPVAICEGAVVKMGTRIYGASTIGPCCTVGGELKQVILFGFSNKAHDGYLGDAIVGEWCNFGAGSSNSNVKNTAGPVNLQLANGLRIAAGHKFGLLMGDYSRAAINTAFNTGTTVGVSANVFGAGLTPAFIPSFAWGLEGGRYRLAKAFTDIDNWKKMKGSGLSGAEKQILTHIFETI